MCDPFRVVSVPQNYATLCDPFGVWNAGRIPLFHHTNRILRKIAEVEMSNLGDTTTLLDPRGGGGDQGGEGVNAHDRSWTPEGSHNVAKTTHAIRP